MMSTVQGNEVVTTVMITHRVTLATPILMDPFSYYKYAVLVNLMIVTWDSGADTWDSVNLSGPRMLKGGKLGNDTYSGRFYRNDRNNSLPAECLSIVQELFAGGPPLR